MARWLLVLLLPLLVPAALQEADLAEHDDECQSTAEVAEGGESCALNALQRGLRKVASVQEHKGEPPALQGDPTTPETEAASSTFEDLGLMPTTKGDAEGVPIEDLGSDELDRLQSASEEVRLQRDIDAMRNPPKDDNTTTDMISADAVTELSSACGSRLFSGGGGAETCFCQLAGNKGCGGQSCRCPQGCKGTTWQHSSTVTFKNKARAHGCSPSTVLLTEPRGYFRDTSDLMRANGGTCANGVLQSLLRDSWNLYQAQVAPGPVWQCFHMPQIASVKYLHLQTFCGTGNFHGMPSHNHNVASCAKMKSIAEVPALAGQLAHMLR